MIGDSIDWFGNKKKKKDDPSGIQGPDSLFNLKVQPKFSAPPKREYNFLGLGSNNGNGNSNSNGKSETRRPEPTRSTNPFWGIKDNSPIKKNETPFKMNSPALSTPARSINNNYNNNHKPFKIFPLRELFKSTKAKFMPLPDPILSPDPLFKKERITDTRLSRWGDPDFDGTPTGLDCNPRDWRKDAMGAKQWMRVSKTSRDKARKAHEDRRNKRSSRPRDRVGARDTVEALRIKQSIVTAKLKAMKLGQEERIIKKVEQIEKEERATERGKELRTEARRYATKQRNKAEKKRELRKFNIQATKETKRIKELHGELASATKPVRGRKAMLTYGVTSDEIRRKLRTLKTNFETGRIPMSVAERETKKLMTLLKPTEKEESKLAKVGRKLDKKQAQARAQYETYRKATFGGKKEIVGALAEAKVQEFGMDKGDIRKYNIGLEEAKKVALTPKEINTINKYREMEDQHQKQPAALQAAYKIAHDKEALIIAKYEKPSVLEKWQPFKDETLDKLGVPDRFRPTVEISPLSRAERVMYQKKLAIAEKIKAGKEPSLKELKSLEKAREEAAFRTRAAKFAAKVEPVALSFTAFMPGAKHGVVGEGLHYTKEARKASEQVGKLVKTGISALFGPSLTRSFQGKSEPRQRGRPSGPSGSYKISGRPVYEQEYQDYMAKQNAMRRMSPSEEQAQTLNPEYIDELRRQQKQREIMQMVGQGPDQAQGAGQPPMNTNMNMEMAQQIEQAQSAQIQNVQQGQQEQYQQDQQFAEEQGGQQPTEQYQPQPQQYDIKQLQQSAQDQDQILKAPQFAKGELKGTGGSLLTPIGPQILDAPNSFKGEMRNLNRGAEIPAVKLGDRPQTNPMGEEYLSIDLGSGKPRIMKRSREKFMTGEAL